MSFCILLHKIINNFHILLTNNNSLSLSLFEALRGLRDSVASESNNGNDEETHNINGPIQRKNPIDDEMDYDDFLISYHRDDPGALEFIEMAETEGSLPRTRDQYKNMRKKLRRERLS